MNALHTVPADIAPGVYEIDAEAYHAGPGASVSMLRAFADSPARMRFGIRRETATQRFGTLIHCAVLEPDTLDARFCATDLERFDSRTAAYKAEAERADGRELVKRAEFDEACRIRDAAHAHPIAGELLAPAGLLVERSFYWTCPETGLLLRGRADGLRPDMRVIVDLKSTTDASPREFARSAAEYRYHWQAAHYCDGVAAAAGWEPEAFIFIAVEKAAPFLVGVYELDAIDMDKARERLSDTKAAFAESLLNDVWPGHSASLERLDLPEWAHR
ncbi:PD-(D/E)XK nuclease-like domain-containing protein [Azospirillum picis]|uniref:Putative exodeoxyribonuclease 8 PDDEXK-like domain-containing protein n=1 Tax=Azospirillum picis TaxID=488438 RepID=A0ABU0MPG0_9PROT|nr:PD-(D/E)XK nuclease-like domain-containing protein [Azospirillum picis]MBP2301528.1 hypothetical protein [Azospirillum picis]MDQ0535360.1 hypothetical protein [Azospirillum picis]